MPLVFNDNISHAEVINLCHRMRNANSNSSGLVGSGGSICEDRAETARNVDRRQMSRARIELNMESHIPTKANGYAERNVTIRVAMRQQHSVYQPETSAPSQAG